MGPGPMPGPGPWARWESWTPGTTGPPINSQVATGLLRLGSKGLQGLGEDAHRRGVRRAPPGRALGIIGEEPVVSARSRSYFQN